MSSNGAKDEYIVVQRCREPVDDYHLSTFDKRDKYGTEFVFCHIYILIVKVVEPFLFGL